MRKPTSGFRPGYTNQAVQLQKMARGLKFGTWKVEGLYYLCSENKDADLRLCFRICKTLVFSQRGSYLFDLVEKRGCTTYIINEYEI